MATIRKCDVCGEPLLDDSLFCYSCGTKRKKCSCGGFIDAGMKFCPKCGRKIDLIGYNFIDRGDYIELRNPIGNIRMIEKVCSPDTNNWNEASLYAQNLRKGGFTDWRLPTKDELLEIYKIKDICGINKNEYWFWSSSPAELYGYAVDVCFNDGHVGLDIKCTGLAYFRCVR